MTDVAGRIRAAIAERGPITFAEFMEEALLGPGGFFERPPVGAEGDFLTAPHVHPVFADLLRFALADLRKALGDPDPMRVVDLGAGDGTLAQALRVGALNIEKVNLEISGVDASDGALAALERSSITAAARIEDLPPGDPACVIANELLDNLPFRWLRRNEDGFVEVRVAADGDTFVAVEAPCDDELAAMAGDVPVGGDAFVSPAALDLIDALAVWLHRGYVLLIDYGWPDRPAGEVHGYRAHRSLSDVLLDPGSSDITAGVDFGLIARRAEAAGLTVLGQTTQASALRALGYSTWQETQRERQLAFEREGEGRMALRVWEGRSLASLLVDSGGMGAFRWLLLATPGLPAPDWIA